MILTSRFPFPHLSRYSGTRFHHLKLKRLDLQDGVSLLKKLGIRGTRNLLGEYVEKLSGHPLALKILAATVKNCCQGELAQFEGIPIPAIGREDEVDRKLSHLLDFYGKRLKNGQKELLGIISLFKTPLDIKSLVTLLGGMKSLKGTPLAGADEAAIQEQVSALAADFLIEEIPQGITCHPVIRDSFRERFTVAGSLQEVAGFLQNKPGGKRPQNIEEVRYLVDAVQLLCEAGEFKAADDLRFARLARGGHGFNAFKDLPAPVEGLACSLAFVGDESRWKKVETSLTRAERILRPARLPQEHCRLEWAWGLLAEAKGDYREGLRRVQESLLLSADKGFRLWEADGLSLGGRLYLMQYKKEGKKDQELLEKAGDNGQKALRIAEECGYCWAKFDALELLHSYHLAKSLLPGPDAKTGRELAEKYLDEARMGRADAEITEREVKNSKLDPENKGIFESQVMGRRDYRDGHYDDYRDPGEYWE